MSGAPSSNGTRLSWPVLISFASLLLASIGGGWSLVKGQIDGVRREMNDMKVAANADRDLIRRQADVLGQQIATLGANKAENSRVDGIVRLVKPSGELEARMDAIERRLDALNQRATNIVNALDSTYNLINEHLREGHHGQGLRNKPIEPDHKRR